jgi:hypothetical protein
LWHHRLVVRTQDSHSCNRGSIPRGAAKQKYTPKVIPNISSNSNMIRITRDTFQKLLLSELSKVSSQKGDLIIDVISLPLFLSTSIAFKIFDYQLRNYPRRVVWKTDDSKIEEMMNQAEILKISKKLASTTLEEHHNKSITPKRLDLIQISENQPKEGDKKSYNFLSVIDTLDEDNHDQNRPQISLQSVFDDHRNNPQAEKPLSPHKSLQDLDSWLDRIEATKSALNSMKSDVFGAGAIQTSQVTKPFSFSFFKPKGFSFISTFFVMALVIASIVIFFPTSAYTLEIRPARKTASMNFLVPQDSFSQQKSAISFESSVMASGISPTQSERATGNVDIINKTSKPFNILAGTKFVNEDKSYIHLRNATLADIITIPPQNEKNPVSLTVQSTDIGQEYGAPIGTQFEIVDGNGVTPCNTCFAIATTPLQGQTPVNQKVISDSDHLLLRSNVEGGLAQKRLDILKDLKQNKKILTNSSWYRNNTSTYTFNKEIGEFASEVKLKADVETTIYYLPYPILENLLKRENKEINTIDQIDLLDSTANFADDSKNDVSIKISYRYSLSLDIDNEKVISTLASDDFLASQSALKKEFSSIANITKYDTGIRIPGIKPAVNVKMITLKD